MMDFSLANAWIILSDRNDNCPHSHGRQIETTNRNAIIFLHELYFFNRNRLPLQFIIITILPIIKDNRIPILSDSLYIYNHLLIAGQ